MFRFQTNPFAASLQWGPMCIQAESLAATHFEADLGRQALDSSK